VEEKLLDVLLGKKKEIYNKPINISAAIFGAFWYFYKKCYLVALGMLLIFVPVFIPGSPFSSSFWAFWILRFLVNLFFGNKIYLWVARRRINRILSKNPNTSEDELINITKKKSGDNSAIAIIVGITLLLGSLPIIYVVINIIQAISNL
jgi:uncharacterized protein YneF (UPF0154 family)